MADVNDIKQVEGNQGCRNETTNKDSKSGR